MEQQQTEEFDYSFVDAVARIAVYDDLLSSPQIIDIEPDTTREYINALASAVYSNAKLAGGTIPFSIILQVSENFIHSRFRDVVVSILDGGNTIRFSDQGPGIADKEKAQLPGYSSATAPMKKIIHGVGSGLPIVREYMETKNGTIRIEDNMEAGAVVTISLAESGDSPSTLHQEMQPQRAIGHQPPAGLLDSQIQMALDELTPRALDIVKVLSYEDVMGVTGISNATEIPPSSTHTELKKLEEAGIMTRLGKKYRLTELGVRVAQNIA